MNSKNKISHKLIKCSKCKLCKYNKYCKRFRKCSKNRCSNNTNSKYKSKHKSKYKSKHTSKSKICKIGSRAKVFHGICTQTSGGLHKNDLIYNSIGKIVSKKASSSALKSKNLGKFLTIPIPNIFTKSPKIGTNEYNNIINN